jgi:putative ABC transport system permease protein
MRLDRLAALAARSAWRQRRRTWPAASGIAVGVASMVAMVGVGEGAERAVVERVRVMGSDLVVVSAGQVKVVAGRARQVGNVSTLSLEDAAALARDCPSVLRTSPVQSRKLLVRAGDVSANTTVLGGSAELLAVRNLAVAEGRAFDDDEARAALRVALLGPTVARNVFGDRPPVGATLRVNGVPFEVVGLLSPKGLDASGNDQDDVVVVPIRTALRRLFNLDHLSNVYVQARPGRAAQAAGEVAATLRERHRVKPGRAEDFTVQNQGDALAAEQGAAEGFTALLGAVSAVALVIGGVGVLAVMLIAVRERVREVGLRRAVGATRSDVLLLFAGEALWIGVAGSGLGLAAGAAAAWGASLLGGWPVHVSGASAARAMAASTLVAVAFGAIPARRAAGLDPAASLRSA